MNTFEFKVNIQASDNAKAKQVLKAMFDIKKGLSDEDLIGLAIIVKEKPHLIKKAKMFL
jgi:hypothetical protein